MSKSRSDFPLRAYFGHHKCASSWINFILMGICGHMGIRFKIVHLPRSFASHGSLADYLTFHKVDFLSYTNADARYLKDVDVYRGIHVIRDPRDIVVSAYFSHRDTHELFPEIVEHRSRLRASSKEEGLLHEIDFSEREFRELSDWDYDQDHVLELKMENVTADAIDSFRQMARFLEIVDPDEPSGFRRAVLPVFHTLNRIAQHERTVLPGLKVQSPIHFRRFSVPMSVVERVTQQKSFESLTNGRSRGSVDETSHYRKGTPGDWRNHFTPAHVDRFKERYPDLLVKLGYEKTNDWTL